MYLVLGKTLHFLKRLWSFLLNFEINRSTHTGEKPYQFTNCNMPFTEKGTLDKHQKTHTGEKLITAIIVKKAFSEENLEYILGLTLLFNPGYFK